MSADSDLDADLFASEQTHHEFQGLSFLCRELDGLVGRQASSSLIELQQQQGEHRAHYIHQTDVYTNLLVRDSEIISGVLTTDTAVIPPPTDNDILVKITNPHMLVAFNPRPDAHKIKLAKDECPEKMKVDHKEPPTLGDISEGIVKAVLHKYVEGGNYIFFEDHVGYLVGLLKACHATDIGPDAYAKAIRDLRTYVYLTSHPKMQRRLKLGQGSNNMFAVITAAESEFPSGTFEGEISQTANITEAQSQALPESDQQEFITSFFSDAGIPDQLIPKHKPLYDIQGRRVFHGMLREILRRINGALEDLHRWKTSTWEVNDEEIASVEKKVQRLEAAMIWLDHFVVLFGKRPLRPSQNANGPNPPDLLTVHLSWLGRAAGVSTRTDKPFFLVASGNPVTPEPPVVHASSTPSKQPQRASTPMQSPSTTTAQLQPGLLVSQPQTPNVPAFSEEAPTTAKSIDTDADDDATLSDDDADENDPKPDVDEETSDDDDQLDDLCSAAARIELQARGPSMYAACAFKYLELLGLHQHGMQQACPGERNFATKSNVSWHILNTKVSVVSIDMPKHEKHGGQKRMSIKKCLDIVLNHPSADGLLDRRQLELRITRAQAEKAREKFLTQHPTAVDPDHEKVTAPTGRSIDEIRAAEILTKRFQKSIRQKRNAHLDNEGFFGSIHAENILMACKVLLHELQKSDGGQKKLTDNEWLERNGLFELQSILISQLRHPLPLMTVSKRCCSVCWSVFQEMRKKGVISSETAVPGKHFKCWGVRLPPFLLKGYVAVAREAAIEEALTKLKRLQELINKDDLSSKGVNSSNDSKGSNQTFGQPTPSKAFQEKVQLVDDDGDFISKFYGASTSTETPAVSAHSHSSSSPKRSLSSPSKNPSHMMPPPPMRVPDASPERSRKLGADSDEAAAASPAKKPRLNDVEESQVAAEEGGGVEEEEGGGDEEEKESADTVDDDEEMGNAGVTSG